MTQPLLPGARLRGSSSAARSRDQDLSLERVFRDHHQEIYRYCLAIVRNRADAEDALQATMSAAVRSLAADEREIEIRPWLFRVAHNEAISIIRRRREHPSDTLEESIDESAADRVEERDRLRTLVADLRTLPERQRSALVMRELSDLGYDEIAKALGCGEGAARQVVHEARTALATKAEGRNMECEAVRRAIDEGDRRRLRGRKLEAHLDSCQGCRDFKLALQTRRHDLAAITPPLPAAAASGLLAALVGGSAGGPGTAGGLGAAAAGGSAGATGATGAIGGTGIAGGAVAKAASVIAAVAIAGGAAEVSGVVDLPVVPGGKSSEATPASDAEPASAVTGAEAGEGAGEAGAPAGKRGAKGEAGGKGGGGNAREGRPKRPGRAGGRSKSAPPAHSNAGGKKPDTPGAGRGRPDNPGSPPQAGGNPTPPQAGGNPGTPPQAGGPAPAPPAGGGGAQGGGPATSPGPGGPAGGGAQGGGAKSRPDAAPGPAPGGPPTGSAR